MEPGLWQALDKGVQSTVPCIQGLVQKSTTNTSPDEIFFE